MCLFLTCLVTCMLGIMHTSRLNSHNKNMQRYDCNSVLTEHYSGVLNILFFCGVCRVCRCVLCFEVYKINAGIMNILIVFIFFFFFFMHVLRWCNITVHWFIPCLRLCIFVAFRQVIFSHPWKATDQIMQPFKTQYTLIQDMHFNTTLYITILLVHKYFMIFFVYGASCFGLMTSYNYNDIICTKPDEPSYYNMIWRFEEKSIAFL